MNNEQDLKVLRDYIAHTCKILPVTGPKMLELFDKVMADDGWIKCSDRMPISFISGDYDGLKSEQVITIDKGGNYHIAVVYQGFLDGNEFAYWYNNNDYEINDVVKWREIPAE